MEQNKAIIARNISKKFRFPVETTLLKEISLEVGMGESVAITGSSGEGKTTLLQILATLEAPTSGFLEIDGEIVSDKNINRLRNEKIGIIFQSYHLIEDETVVENVLLPARLARRSTRKGSVDYERAIELLRMVNLLGRSNFYAGLLSGGEKQRVAIARAFLNRPKVLLADEPSGNLDETHAAMIYDLLLNMADSRKTALVVVTHDLSFAARCQRRYNLVAGDLFKEK